MANHTCSGERERDGLWCFLPPVNTLIVMHPLLFNVDLLMLLFCRKLYVFLVVGSFSACWF